VRTAFRFPARNIVNDEVIEGVLISIEQTAAPSNAFGGPPPPRFARGRNLQQSPCVNLAALEGRLRETVRTCRELPTTQLLAVVPPFHFLE
jgi:hypothetical protein